jgi:hypothetical protein
LHCIHLFFNSINLYIHCIHLIKSIKRESFAQTVPRCGGSRAAAVAEEEASVDDDGGAGGGQL